MGSSIIFVILILLLVAVIGTVILGVLPSVIRKKKQNKANMDLFTDDNEEE